MRGGRQGGVDLVLLRPAKRMVVGVESKGATKGVVEGEHAATQEADGGDTA